jgi:large subunit ribosomal protein L6
MKKKDFTKKLKNTSFFFDKENKGVYIEGPLGIRQLETPRFRSKNLFRAFLRKNMIGVSVPFVVRLNFVGVGFRVEDQTKNELILKIGYSHLVYVPIPNGIKVIVQKKINIILSGSDEQLVKEFAAVLRSYRFPDVYKGKGLLFKNEKINLKEGKSR